MKCVDKDFRNQDILAIAISIENIIVSDDVEVIHLGHSSRKSQYANVRFHSLKEQTDLILVLHP